jgi:hypothetical protein
VSLAQLQKRCRDIELLKQFITSRKSLKVKFLLTEFDKVAEFILAKLMMEHGFDSY